MFDPADGYLLSAVLLLAGGIVFAGVVLHVVRSVRRFVSVGTAVRKVWRGELLLLKARTAALKIAVHQRWPKSDGVAPHT
ncbi:hypothetical protein [Haloechinothrix salitolerans]|uniref:Uncharacterized protein n=1 Tax=Haloechinothrix salitolerans TaxID=926830 RepID=A0ABW2C1K6_9PSEU